MLGVASSVIIPNSTVCDSCIVSESFSVLLMTFRRLWMGMEKRNRKENVDETGRFPKFLNFSTFTLLNEKGKQFSDFFTILYSFYILYIS